MNPTKEAQSFFSKRKHVRETIKAKQRYEREHQFLVGFCSGLNLALIGTDRKALEHQKLEKGLEAGRLQKKINDISCELDVLRAELFEEATEQKAKIKNLAQELYTYCEGI